MKTKKKGYPPFKKPFFFAYIYVFVFNNQGNLLNTI